MCAYFSPALNNMMVMATILPGLDRRCTQGNHLTIPLAPHGGGKAFCKTFETWDHDGGQKQSIIGGHGKNLIASARKGNDSHDALVRFAGVQHSLLRGRTRPFDFLDQIEFFQAAEKFLDIRLGNFSACAELANHLVDNLWPRAIVL